MPLLRPAALPALVAVVIAGHGIGGGWHAAHAGAWPAPEGATLAIAKLSHSKAPQGFDAAGRLIPGADFEKTEFEIYAEHGLRETVTLVLKPAFQNVRAGSEVKHGLASIEAGLRTRLHRFADGSVVSAQAAAIVPGGKFDRDHPLLTSGHGDVEARLLYGQPADFFGLVGFTDMQLAWRRRGGPPADEIRVDATYGVDLGEDWAIALGAQAVATVGEVRAPFTHYRAQKIQGSLRYSLGGGRHLEVGGLRTVSGAGTVRETGIFIAVWSAF